MSKKIITSQLSLLSTQWDQITSEELLRLVLAAQATFGHEPNLSVYDARMQLMETSMGLAAESNNAQFSYTALGQARTHLKKGEIELEYRAPLITGQEADDIMRQAMEAILPICLTAVMDSASMIRQSPEMVSSAVYEGALETLETYDLDHGVKVGFWAYMVTLMKVNQLTDRNTAEQSSSTVAVQQLQRTLKRAAAQLYGKKTAEVEPAMISFFKGKRPENAWEDNRSTRERTQDWIKENRARNLKAGDIQLRLFKGEITEEEAERQLQECALEPEVAQALLEERMRGSRGLVHAVREFGTQGHVAAEVILTSASLIEQLSKNGDDTLIGGLSIGNDDLINEVLRRGASRGTKISRELVEGVVNYMLSGGGTSLSLMDEEGDINHWVDRRASEQQEQREVSQRVNRVAKLISEPNFGNLLIQHPSMAVQVVNDRIRTMTAEEENTLQHFVMEQDIGHPNHPWNVRTGDGWLKRLAVNRNDGQEETDDMINAVVGQRHKRLGGLENMLLPDHRMTGETEVHYGPKGIDSYADLQLDDLTFAVM